ncbi:hypothetical protein E3N88_33426 [Mikania micrantha]|uniref:NB-ARC domain-containing protein n=1 Tax=Mikania micrantha TaxID=192012 RepID=A0A5N6MB91_9ASTR|nr:hypothetical protein E3N88_33426 [Mikania micrantha]
MSIKYTRESLSMSIARQLFIIHANEEWEAEDDTNEQESHHAEVPDTNKLIQIIHEKIKDKNIVVILDDVGDGKNITSNEKTFWSVWEEMLKKADQNLKIKTVLITRLKREDTDFSEKNSFEVKPLNREASISLLKEKLDPRLQEKIHNIGNEFIKKLNSDLPAGTVIMIAKVLNYFCLDESGRLYLERELEEASENYRISKLLCKKHDVLPLGILKDLRWSGYHFYRDSGSLHYSELIGYWILEGYLGDGSMTKLYKKGHGVLMELIDCGVIKVQEGGYVFLDNSLIDVDDLYQDVDQNPSLGLATAIASENEGIGRLTYNDGMLKTIGTRKTKKDLSSSSSSSSSSKYGQDLLTLLLDRKYAIEREITELFASEHEKLQVFGLFNPTIKSLPKELEKMKGLRVLVLRGCEFLKEVKPTLESLEFLEISGARNLKKLYSSFFKDMSKLKSLHISGLPIKTLPQAIYNLPHIQWLIIKDCPFLKSLDSLSKLQKLIVVDLSGNKSLDNLDKNFLKFENLQSLNLSKTLVSTTPLLKDRRKLKHLLCKDCSCLVRLRGLSSLTSLQTIDLSGSENFEEFHDSSLESLQSLITLDLSETGIDHLPSNISKPSFLRLKKCLKLNRLSRIESFEKLEVLDLSGSKNLNDIDKNFFNGMKCVRVLNLSETNISHLPSLSDLSDLRELFLSHCHSLINLPSLESAEKLEILDASYCLALHDIESKSLKMMISLQKIDFSETKIESLPPLPGTCNLRQLLLKNCNDLKNLELKEPFPKLEELNLSGIKSLNPNGAEFVMDTISLRILDLSYTSIKQLPSLSKLTNLTHLSLAGCRFSSEPKLNCPDIKIEVLDLSQSSIESLPKFNYTNIQKLKLKGCSMKEELDDKVISTFTHLEYVEYPNNNVKCTPEDMNQDEWNICELSDNEKSPIFLSAIPPKVSSYHACAVPVKVETETWDRYLQRHELVFKDVYLQTRRFSQYKKNKSLQLRGFSQFPKGITNIIEDINLVFLIDCKLNGFSSGFDSSKMKSLKGCWIERCNEMTSIFAEGDNLWFDFPLIDLGICNNDHLERIYDRKEPFQSFDNLTSLYIDRCPELTTVFSSSWLPKKLQDFEIKFCDKISEFGGELPESLQTLKIWECPKIKQLGGELPKSLQTLTIWECPEIKQLGGELPKSLQILTIWECPEIKQLEDKFEIPKGLKTLWISGATKLKNFVTKNDESISLETLKVENCPLLEYLVYNSSQMIQIQIIEIMSCEKMQNLCKDNNGKQDIWSSLKKLRFVDLPKLEKTGYLLPSPLPEDLLSTLECPNLQPID